MDDYKFLYNGEYYPIIIVKKNNKNTYLRVNDELEIVITTNYFITKKYVESLIRDNENTIIKMITRKKKISAKNDDFYLFGKKYNVILGNITNYVEIEENRIYAKDINTLNKYLKKCILDTFSERLRICYNMFEEQIPYPSLKIRMMKTRWGVCNTKNHIITLNTNLHKYDLECLDYVIIHELSHLVHSNHGDSFWKLVYKYCPDYKKIRKMLKE